ncbi:MAG: hypothetical protein K2Q14_00355 [Gammaproteobacteria bacterium]|jgi:hypothetical protein|nr:hypothetical protein [Gammaproteobacteria bacterium]MBY0543982.1 hypothetical protein [Gammaproteobacteria bacterium]
MTMSSPREEALALIEAVADDIPKDLSFDATMDLVFMKYFTLYEAWSKERQEGLSQNAELKSLVKTFDTEVKAFASFEKSTRQALLDVIARAVNQSMKETSGSVIKECTDGAKVLTEGLRQDVAYAKRELEDYKSYLSWQHLKTIGITIGTLVLVSVIALKFLMPSPLTDDQVNAIALAQKYVPIWNHLSSSEQESINKIINNHNNE